MEFLTKMFSKPKQKIYIGFEDLKYAILNKDRYCIINTLSSTEQDCLIYGTIVSSTEEHIINNFIDSGRKDVVLIVYGKHSADESVHIKRTQLVQWGFDTVYIYGGGLFEWFLLQDIYGFSEFPTTSKCRDFLKYRAENRIQRGSMQTITY
jgi:hypothetical protein